MFRKRYVSTGPRKNEDAEIWRQFEHHSRTFSLATRLLPQAVRLPIATLYLFCRAVDNIADQRVQEVGRREALSELDHLRDCLAATVDGNPTDDLLWQRLHEIHECFRLQPEPLYELIDGAAWDLEGRGIDTEEDLLAYSELVAGSVGAMMLPFITNWGSPYAHLLPAARCLGVGMQIANICRDVGEDLHHLGRVYVPSTWLREEGIDAEELLDGKPSPAYALVMERCMSLAEQRFDKGIAGIGELPLRVRLGIRAAARMYREIMNEVRASGYDNLHRRSYVPLPRKATTILFDGYAGRRARLRQNAPVRLDERCLTPFDAPRATT